jgi:hypothetical protein
MIKYPKTFQRLEYARFTWRIASVLEVLLWVCFAIAEVIVALNAVQAFRSNDCAKSTSSGVFDACSSGGVAKSVTVALAIAGLLIVTLLGMAVILLVRFAVMKASAATIEIAAENGVTLDADEEENAQLANTAVPVGRTEISL